MTTITTPAAGHDQHSGLIDAAVGATMARHHIPGMSLAITSGERLLFAAGFGCADLATGTPATDSTQYLWFSLTKIATATAAMRLVDAGKLHLDRPVTDFVAGYPTGNSAPPTVGQLLSHTSGVANPIPVRWVRPADQPAPDQREFLDTLLARYDTPKYPVGGAPRYSNVGYLILAEVIAQASARPFTTFVTDAVLRPLRMERTGFAYHPGSDTAVGYVRVPRIANPMLRRLLPTGIVGERIGRYTALNPFLVNGAGYGGLVGNVTDAARLAAMHLANGTLDDQTILDADTARSMRRTTAVGKSLDVGLGWVRKRPASGLTVVEHLGAGGGFYNAMRLYPDLGIGIVAMANTTSPWNHAELFDTIARGH